jgi:hypothetical protein
VVRAGSSDKLGPAREIHAGSGYWSQESAVQVFAGLESVTRMSVRWPGGKAAISDVPSGAKEISLDPSGAVKVVR